MTKHCFIDGRRYEIGDVVLDINGGTPARVTVRSAEPDGWRWFVARCNPNCDERAAKSLDAAGLRVFQPQHKVLRGRIGKQQEVLRALFPRYLFVGLPVMRRGFGDEIDFRLPCRCDGVEDLLRDLGRRPVELRGYLGVDGETIMTGDEIVASFRTAQEAGEIDEKPAARPGLGDLVRITKGPLAGFQAVVAAIEPDQRMAVLIDMMGRKHPLKLRREDAEAA